MSRCGRGCGDLIAKGEPRLGEPLKDSRGDYGVIAGWRHVACTRLPDDSRDKASFDCAAEVFGFANLSAEHQALVRSELSKTDVPAHLVAIGAASLLRSIVLCIRETRRIPSLNVVAAASRVGRAFAQSSNTSLPLLKHHPRHSVVPSFA
jgi:hypothetical protein